MSDDEIALAVREDLRNNDRMELEELEVSFRNGVVHLEGAMPSRRRHRVLLDFVQNILGLKNIADKVRIDRLAWERQDRKGDSGTAQGSGIPYEDLEALAEGAQEGQNIFHSLKSGKPVAPSDEFLTDEES
jgi:hypothetical protein